jgi:carnitine O-palmitoyltransferase 2
LHGNGNNRWFDQGLSVHIGKDGTFSSSFEHSWGDGLAVLRWARFIHEKGADYVKELAQQQQQSGNGNNLNKNIVATPLDWGSSISPRVLNAAQDAYKKFVQFANYDLRLETRIFREFGTRDLKRCKISPDGVFQNAIQLAYRRLKGKTVATYESCSTQMFAGGRTETIRSASIESSAFVMEMMDCLVEDSKTRTKLLRQAAERHSQLAMDAAEGRGFDRHLFVLKQLAIANGVQSPLLFGAGYDLLSKNILSTSTVSHPFIEQAAFGPVVGNGLGICYHMFDDAFHFCITSYEDDVKEMCDVLERSLKDCGALLGVHDK